ncbi:CheR family methyltransferase [Paracoccus methylarcula]|nr:CheR family methyltransferase [Paracoccus methylarcula]
MAQNPLSTATPRLHPRQARTLVEIARKITGVAVSTDKISFLELRVSRRLRELGCADYDSYIAKLHGPDGMAEARYLAEALTTHTTSFFREKVHYDWLAREGLPNLAEAGAGTGYKLTIWSAACSLGSEMWTAAMVLDQFSQTRKGGLSWGVVGTDVSRQILRQAATAVFTEDQVTGIPAELRRSYLMRSRGEPRLYRIVPELRSRAQLAWANLVDLDRTLKLTADVAFLRNVLIYFQPEDQRRAVANVVSRLRDGGYLLTGHSESLADPPANLRQVAASTYQKV